MSYLKKLAEKCKTGDNRAFAVLVLSCCLAVSIFVGAMAVNAVYIDDDGHMRVVYTSSQDLQDVLASSVAATKSTDEVVMTGFTGNVASLKIKRSYEVPILVDGKTLLPVTTGGTVGELLTAVGITLSEDDLVSAELTAPVTRGMDIKVSRISYQTLEKTEEIPFETTEKATVMLAKGKTAVSTEGQAGARTTTVRQKLVDGKVVEETVIDEAVTKNPVDRVVLTGSAPGTPISQLTPPDSLVLDADGKPVNYTSVLTNAVSAAYSARPGAGTASGRKAMVGYVAVDPRVIPYGTKLYITTPDNRYIYGYAIAADTGTALRDGIIDVDLFFGSYAESCRWGKKLVNIYILP